MQLLERQSVDDNILEPDEDLGNEELNRALKEIKQARHNLCGSKGGKQENVATKSSMFLGALGLQDMENS